MCPSLSSSGSVKAIGKLHDGLPRHMRLGHTITSIQVREVTARQCTQTSGSVDLSMIPPSFELKMTRMKTWPPSLRGILVLSNLTLILRCCWHCLHLLQFTSRYVYVNYRDSALNTIDY